MFRQTPRMGKDEDEEDEDEKQKWRAVESDRAMH